MVALRLLTSLGVFSFLVACGGGGGTPPPIEVTTLAATGPGSLPEAVAMAPAGTTIKFQSGLAGTIGLGGGALVIGKPLTIQGPPTGGIVLSGEGTSGILEIAATGSATLSDLELRDGLSGSGAGIYCEGTVTLTRVQIVNCTASGSNRGGGLNVVGGVATLTECTITLHRCLVTGNLTSGNSGAGGLNSGGDLVLVNCTFHDNQTTGGNRVGGGLAIFVEYVPAYTTVLSCTFTNNTATGEGGGIYSDGEAGPPAVLSVLRIENSIIAGNTSGLGGPDCDLVTPGILLSAARNNVIGIDLGSMIANGVDGNQVGSAGVPLDPLLGALADNGGPTFTLLPGPGSVARNAVPTAECLDEDDAPLAVDQRGFSRPVGGACDAGAVESP